MKTQRFYIHLVGGLIPGVILIACVSQSTEDRLSKMGPVHGPSDVNFAVSTTDGNLDLSNTADLARTLGQYRRLNYSESEKVRNLAQKKFDGFVVQEIRNLQPKYEARKRVIRKSSAAPEQVAAQLAKLDREIRQEAVIAVKRRYGSRMAVPVKTRDNKPAVAIATFSGDQAKAPGSAVELSKKPGSTIEHQGKETPVVGSTVNLP